MEAKEAILSQTFTVLPIKRHCNVHLTLEGLNYLDGEPTANSKAENQHVMHLADIIGCGVENKQFSTNRKAAHFTVYSYPRGKEKAKYTGVLRRVKKDVTFVCEEHQEQQKNAEIVAEWMQQIDNVLQESYVKRGRKISKWLFMINPYSGRKQALQMFRKTTEPMLKEAKIDYTVLVTERPYQARLEMQDLDFDKFGGVVTVSGDGLLFEVINGLMDRGDWDETFRFPIGALPAGSGNAICCSANYKAGESYIEDAMLHSTFLLLKHVPQPLDLMEVELCDASLAFACVLFSWAIVGDATVSGEKWRWMGPARFKFVGISKILKLKSYRAKLSFLPIESYKPPDKKSGEESEHSGSERADTNDKNANISDQPPGAEQHPRRNASGMYCVYDPCPEDWVTFEDEFIYFTATLISHQYADFVTSPAAEFDDGIITLALIRKGTVTRKQLLDMFGRIGEVDDEKRDVGDLIEFIKVREFKLHPKTRDGGMALDGEIVKCGNMKARVRKAAANLMGGV